MLNFLSVDISVYSSIINSINGLSIKLCHVSSSTTIATASSISD